MEWVKGFQYPGFYRFSQKDKQLMAKYNNGKKWYVCGFLDHEIDGLPIWSGVENNS